MKISILTSRSEIAARALTVWKNSAVNGKVMGATNKMHIQIGVVSRQLCFQLIRVKFMSNQSSSIGSEICSPDTGGNHASRDSVKRSLNPIHQSVTAFEDCEDSQ